MHAAVAKNALEGLKYAKVNPRKPNAILEIVFSSG
jgi:hypothetical protein